MYGYSSIHSIKFISSFIYSDNFMTVNLSTLLGRIRGEILNLLQLVLYRFYIKFYIGGPCRRRYPKTQL